MKKTIALILTIIFLFSITSCQVPEKENETDNFVYASKDLKKEEATNKGNKTPAKETETEKIIEYYTINFQTNGGTNITSEIKAEGTTLNKVTTPTKKGYLFEGWFTDSSLTTAAAFPMPIYSNITLYAKWLCLEKTISLNDIKIKNTNDNGEKTIYITPDGFDMNKLSSLSYNMKITVSYTVRYQKDYDVPLDVGYWPGDPQYDVSLLDSGNIGDSRKNIKTSKTAVNKTITYSASVSNLKNDILKLSFSTSNIQNIIIIENIKVSYVCTK